MHMGVLSAGIFEYHIYPCCLRRLEAGVESPGTRILDSCEPLYGCWESTLSLQEQSVSLTADSTLQPLLSFKT